MYPSVQVGSRSYTRPACRANIGDCMKDSTAAPAPTNEVIACLKGGLQACKAVGEWEHMPALASTRASQAPAVRAGLIVVRVFG